jgi:hypothetical protein
LARKIRKLAYDHRRDGTVGPYEPRSEINEDKMTVISARLEQTNAQLPANNWLTNNFTLEIIRAKVAANKANAIINV